VVYSASLRSLGEQVVGIGSVALIMLGMIALSIVLELILPLGIKQALGKAICWTMMGITMTFLGLATVGLVLVFGQNVLLPLLRG
jgi:hypothetical protein